MEGSQAEKKMTTGDLLRSSPFIGSLIDATEQLQQFEYVGSKNYMSPADGR